jgi:hypothetical protein
VGEHTGYFVYLLNLFLENKFYIIKLRLNLSLEFLDVLKPLKVGSSLSFNKKVIFLFLDSTYFSVNVGKIVFTSSCMNCGERRVSSQTDIVKNRKPPMNNQINAYIIAATKETIIVLSHSISQ